MSSSTPEVSAGERPIVVVDAPVENTRLPVRHYHIIRTVAPGPQRREQRPVRNNINDHRFYHALGSVRRFPAHHYHHHHSRVVVAPVHRAPNPNSKKEYYRLRNEIVAKMYDAFDRGEALLDRACDLIKGVESVEKPQDRERVETAVELAERCVPLCKEIVGHIEFLDTEVTQRTLGRYDIFRDALQAIFKRTDALLPSTPKQ